jgi:GTP-binding protein HflX
VKKAKAQALIDIEEKKPRAFLVGIREEKMSAAEADSLSRELAGLVDTLGLEIVSQEIVKLRERHSKYGLGSGKAGELAEKAASLKADCIIFDRDISPSQQRNWENLTGISAIDREELIIQIFASRARTREAELQISLAEHIHALPRLQHKYIDLAQQRGGRYGTRGAGETLFETDRLQLEGRIYRLKQELEEVKRQRQVQRRQRERQAVPVCALVGYTNAGKSSILNALTGAAVFAEDKLFATLDSTARHLMLPKGSLVLLIDTVGFIRRLPHSLVNAFRSTLEEASRADLLLNVLDASDPDLEKQYETTLAVLRDLGAANIPMIPVLNKIDKLDHGGDQSRDALLKAYPGGVPVSALNKSGLDELNERIEHTINKSKNQHKKL